MQEICASYRSWGVDHCQVVAIEHGAPKGGKECYRQQRAGQVLQTAGEREMC